MKIAMQFAGSCPVELANVWYENIRKFMDCPIVQFTDMDTPRLDFADEVQRIDEPDLPKAKYRHLSMLKGEVLNLDYDVKVQKDVSDVFRRPFDIALTLRKTKEEKWKLLYAGSPHNTGVVFSRNTDFWKLCAERYDKYPKHSGWMVGQVNITECAHIYRDRFKVLELPAYLYNYSPRKRDEDVSQRFMVHYNGPRKHWMADTKEVFDEGVRVSQLAKAASMFTPDHPNYKVLVKLTEGK